jgi:membrane-bound lytic murein transglycosylase B|tara:strand:- start:4631 stop:5626 length:996 start_codon:yes stop_codon:yes gene_type:complete
MYSFFKIVIFLFLFIISFFTSALADNSDKSFEEWLLSYKNKVLKKGISRETINIAFKNVKFLEQVIIYDRKQPEFFEDTITYVKKRATPKKVKEARKLLKKNNQLFNEIENKFNVDKEILLSLWGIETIYGKYVGKMDIISSLATLSYDKRRSDFFSSQLFTVLQLIDKKLIDPSKYYGSWAGAYGNFQFMPSTIKKYAIDYDNNEKIELKNSLEDSLASAANYINKIGWKREYPCLFQVNTTKKIKKKYVNFSARKIHHRLKISEWKKMGVVNIDGSDLQTNYKAALILPDGEPNTPTYLVFSNYEKILKWNKSLRFGISVCTLAKMIKI